MDTGDANSSLIHGDTPPQHNGIPIGRSEVASLGRLPEQPHVPVHITIHNVNTPPLQRRLRLFSFRDGISVFAFKTQGHAEHRVQHSWLYN